MARVAITAVVLALGGCGALSANSSTSLAEVGANAGLYGAMAAARAIPAPVEAHGRSAPTTRRHVEAPTHHYLCVAGGEERRVRAHSRARAEATCGPDCACVDALIADELRLYE